MKLDTAQDRLCAVRELEFRAARIGDGFKNTGQYVIGDLLGLIAIQEKLNALADLIQTETLWEDAIGGMLGIEDADTELRERCVAICSSQAYVFLRSVLARHVESVVNFATNKFASRRLMKLQRDMRETMEKMREVYAERYGF